MRRNVQSVLIEVLSRILIKEIDEYMLQREPVVCHPVEQRFVAVPQLMQELYIYGAYTQCDVVFGFYLSFLRCRLECEFQFVIRSIARHHDRCLDLCRCACLEIDGVVSELVVSFIESDRVDIIQSCVLDFYGSRSGASFLCAGLVIEAGFDYGNTLIRFPGLDVQISCGVVESRVVLSEEKSCSESLKLCLKRCAHQKLTVLIDI